MAGSPDGVLPFADPVLLARLDSIHLLGERLNEPVSIIDQLFNVVYANRPAFGSKNYQIHDGSPLKCYAAFVRRSEPCPACPAMEVFETGKAIQSNAGPSTSGELTCGLVQAFPISDSHGNPVCVLQILEEHKRFDHGKQRVCTGHSPETEEWRLGHLIGRSAVMRELFEMIRLVAGSQATVLLQGESGTGKELIARTIHSLSSRRNKPFIVVDCGSLPETLLESELFGHVKGAFTGAVSSKKGLFEEADGGTIFLDEIADTTAHFQSKLLRVLQEGEIKPVGSSRSIKVDVRVISATNKDLIELVKAKSFREDLYYRLAVLPLSLPPLRDRREDIPLLVNHFVMMSCRRHHKPMREVTPEAMQMLMEAPWRGNIRELQHTIERVVVTASGPKLTLQDFCRVGGAAAQAAPCTDLRTVARTAAQAAERARIEEALRQASGKKARAARILKISRASLYNKLRSYGID